MTDKFWSELTHLQLSDEFKDLISRMIEYNEEHRLTLADILAHPWMKGEVATHQQVQEEIIQRMTKHQ